MKQTDCLACAPGKYSASDAADTCDDCPVGQGHDMIVSGASSCLACGKGHDLTGAVVQLWGTCEDQCHANEFRDLQGECQRCGAGTALRSDETGCDACNDGFVSLDGEPCVACGRGMLSNGLRTGCSCMPGGVLGNDEHGNSVCTACSPGRFTADGLSCNLCPNQWSVPANVAADAFTGQAIPGDVTLNGATMCMSCQLSPDNGIELDRERFPLYADVAAAPKTVDWRLCNTEYVACPPGSEANDDLVTPCAACDPGKYSPVGISCDYCRAGQVVNAIQTVCEQCPAGRFHDASNGVIGGACEACGYNKVSSAGQARCTDCPPGQQPNTEREGVPASATCDACSTGRVSTYNTVCVVCPAGKNPDSTRAECDSCDTVSVGAYSSGGMPCVDCAQGKTPNAHRSACKECAANSMGLVGGTCQDTCEFLGCDSTVSLTAYRRPDGNSFAEMTLADACSLSAWHFNDGTLSVTDADGLRTECNMTDPCKRDLGHEDGDDDRVHNITVSATVAGRESTCAVGFQLGLAELDIIGGEPLESTTTSYDDTTFLLKNAGTEAVVLTSIDFNVSWATVVAIRASGVAQSIEAGPLTLGADASLSIVVRATGSAA